jgi:NAD dependent epimerase/dehydratase family
MPNKVPVTGASGLLGVAAIEKFLSAGWDVVGVSRRKPDLPSGRDIEFQSGDLRDEEAARAAFEPLTDITHIAYSALHEKPELVAAGRARNRSRPTTPCSATWCNRSHAPPPISGTSVSCREPRSTACTCTRSRFRPANVMLVRTARTSSSTTKTMCVRWAPSTASTTRHCVRSSSPGPPQAR